MFINSTNNIDNVNIPDEFIEITSLLKLHKKNMRKQVLGILHQNFNNDCEESKRQLMDIMEYSLSSNEDYYRSFFVRILGESLELNKPKTTFIGAIIEMLHSYVIMQNAMPDFENDDFQFNHQTCHKKFGNAETIIALNALINFIMETITSTNLIKINDSDRCNLVKIISKYSGKDGISSGQMMKIILKKKQKKNSQDENTRIKKLKINSLFNAGAECVQLLTNTSSKQNISIKNYINNLCNLINIYNEITTNCCCENNSALIERIKLLTSQGCDSVLMFQNNSKLVSFIKYNGYRIKKTIDNNTSSRPIIAVNSKIETL